ARDVAVRLEVLRVALAVDERLELRHLAGGAVRRPEIGLTVGVRVGFAALRLAAVAVERRRVEPAVATARFVALHHLSLAVVPDDFVDRAVRADALAADDAVAF